jgi:hypothetical protein
MIAAMPRGPWVIVIAIAVGILPSPAWSTPSARLTYVRGPGAERCPDEGELRRAVAARLGYDPFFPWASATVVAEIARRPRGFHGHVKILDEHGLVRGERALDATSEDCGDTMRALALAISIAVDDLATEPVPPPPAETPAQVEAPREPPPPTQAPPPEEARAPTPPPSAARKEVSFAAWMAPIASLGVAPAATLGAHLDAELRYRRLSIGLEARADLPASASTDVGGRVRTEVVLGSLVPCVREPAPLFVCGVLAVGSFSESGVDVAAPRSKSAVYAATGVRLGVELALRGSFFFVAHADGLVTLLRHTVQLDQTDVYTLSPVAASLGLGLGTRF